MSTRIREYENTRIREYGDRSTIHLFHEPHVRLSGLAGTLQKMANGAPVTVFPRIPGRGYKPHGEGANMKRGILIVAALLLAGQSAPAAAQGAAAKLVGAWRLVAATQRMTDGTERPDPNVGAKARGYIIYTSTGQVCAMLANSERARWKVGGQPTEAEALAIPQNMVAYCGTYSVDEAGGFILHHVELDLSPNRAGTDRKRFFTLSGDHLVLRPAPPLPQGVQDWTVTWERAR